MSKPGNGGDPQAAGPAADAEPKLPHYARLAQSVLAALEAAGDLLWVTDPQGRIQHVNGAFERQLGFERREALGQRTGELMGTGFHGEAFYDELWQTLHSGANYCGVLTSRDRNGAIRHLEETIAPVPDEHGRTTHYVAVARDITEATTRRRILEQGAHLAHFGGWELDPATGRAQWTPETYRVLGVDPQREPGPETLLERIRVDDRQQVRQALSAALAGRGPYEVEFRVVDADGTERTVLSRGEVEWGADGHPVRVVGAVQDITDLRAAEERARCLAYYDPLTGLPNRELFGESLDQALPGLEQREGAAAVVLVDLDHFSALNQDLGNAVGDQVLQTVAERLGGELRSGDLLARFESDLFAIFLNDLDRSEQLSPVLEGLREVLGRPLRAGEGEILVTAGMGVALYPSAGRDGQTLLQAAESALQRARRKGRNSYEIYHRSLPGPASGPDAGLEAELHRAVERGELHLAYQPQVDLAQERLCGVEALLRWRRPDGEAVSPARFIPALEETGLIQGVGEWILEEACHQARGWTASGSAGPPRLSVNLSVRQFGDPERLCRAVFRALDNSGLDPARLELEITEGLFLESELHPRDSIQRLRERGVRVALDDFGTGYSALGYLHRFPLDTLKIDQCFIRDLDAPHAEDLVSGILNLARPFGLEVVAEGVETADHARRLHRLGCPLAQGFGYARPGTPGQVAKLLRAGGHLPLQRA